VASPTEARGGERVIQAGERRLARVESMRALAALSVVVGHLWATAHGFNAGLIYGNLWRKLLFGGTLGVWVFFTLTGYLLFWPFVRRDYGGGGRIDLRAYARNRALRILPLYWFAVVFLLLVAVPHPTWTLWWRHLLLVQDFWRDSLGAVDAPLWSIGVELEFYALLPLLAWGVARLAGRSRLRAAAIVLALGAVSAVARQLVALSVPDAATTILRFQLHTTFCFFAAGMTVALLRGTWEQRRPRLLDGPLGSPALWLAAAVPFWVLAAWRFDLELLCVPAGFLTVGAIALPLRPWRGLAVLDWRPLALVGVASYSLYVWHWSLITHLDGGRTLMPHGFKLVLAAFVPPCLVVAGASYLLIERPALRLRRRWAPSSPAPGRQ
jgi:peptidoglycan/LPS O-acetylase OafA/YrhL